MAAWVDPRSPSGLRTLLAEWGLVPRKHWGQHFLVDRNVLDKMARLAEGPPGECLEIGAGPGGLTATLLEHGWRVTALEVDPRLAEVLGRLAALHPGRLKVVASDVLAVSWRDFFAEDKEPVTIFGNLPYYITGPILAKLWEDGLYWSQAVIMVQREVAERLRAPVGSRGSAALAVLLRYHAEVKRGMKVPASCFYPPPEIDSEVLVLRRRQGEEPDAEVPWDAFQAVVRMGFHVRRKTLANALAAGDPLGRGTDFWAQELERCGISRRRRAESLTMAEWMQLASRYAAVARG
jgi:16S rRNA (adenine1518-N6/adenine1519-N6)-dimethyltransferase